MSDDSGNSFSSDCQFHQAHRTATVEDIEVNQLCFSSKTIFIQAPDRLLYGKIGRSLSSAECHNDKR